MRTSSGYEHKNSRKPTFAINGLHKQTISKPRKSGIKASRQRVVVHGVVLQERRMSSIDFVEGVLLNDIRSLQYHEVIRV